MKQEKTRKAFEALKEYERILLLQSYQSMGVFQNKDECYTIEQFYAKIGITDQYKKLNDALLEILQDAGWIIIENGKIRTTGLVCENTTKQIDCEESFKRISREYEDIKDYLCLLNTCVSHYHEIFSGTAKATDVLFKQSGDLVGRVYGGNRFTDYFNSLVADSVRLYVEEKYRENKDGKIRILEIGAGTGGTTKKVLPVLDGYEDVVEYTFTDVSNSFLIQAADLFEETYPFVSYHILDIEKEIEEQFDTLEKQDIIICSNVLHATKNIMVTLQNTQKLLKKTGWLILNELIEPMEYTTMTFGLLDGWWLSEDKELRMKNSPLLSSKQWISCLLELGFVDTIVLGNTKEAQEGIKQNVIISENSKDVALEFKPVEKMIANERSNNQESLDESEICEYIHKTLIHCMVETLRLKSEENYNDAMTFWDYGVDSILVNRIIKKMNEELGIQLSNQDLFSYGSMERLVPYVVEQFGDEIATRIRSTEKVVRITEVAKDNTVDEIKDSKARILDSDGIAVIGMSCKLPKANNVTELWQNLKSGIDCVTEIPQERWNTEEYFNENKEIPATYNCKYGAFMSEIDCFEPMFFRISPKQAELMDPRQRIFLEQAYKTVEDAGYSQQELLGKSVGVFVGCEGDSEYLKDKMVKLEEYSSQLFLGNSNSVLASRISYFMDWKGPSITVDTACSSSSIAIHLACQSLRLEECDMAIAGGVHVCIKPDGYIMLSKMDMLSVDGSCKAFDRSANGFVPGEGVGAVMLKPLSKAKQDGDHIYCVIKASGMNQDGKSNGIMAPNMLSQYELYQRVYEKNHIDPSTIQYIETHGTGTKIGDPMEFDALKKAFSSVEQKSCGLGSIKTYIGHLGPASGIASLIKVILQMQHKELIANLHYSSINESIDIENSPFYICTNNEPWKVPSGEKRRAAVNAFGHSGTNCHIIVDEYIEEERPIESKPSYLFCFSALTEASLMEYLRTFSSWLMENRSVSLGELSYTLNVGRTLFQTRTCIIASTWSELNDKVNQLILKGSFNDCSFEHTQGGVKEAKQLMDELVGKVLSDRDYVAKLERLCELVEKNQSIALSNLYKKSEVRRISIPTYCFRKKSYWLKNNETPVKNKLTYQITPSEAVKGVLYKSVWNKKSNVVSVSEFPSDKLLVFAKEYQLEKLKIDIPNAIYVVPGNEFLSMDQDTVRIRINCYEDYLSLARLIANQYPSGVKVLHLWSEYATEIMEERLFYGVYSIYWFTKSMMETKYSHQVRLLYAYRNDDLSSRPECKAVVAFIETIYLENPRYDYRCVEMSDDLLESEKTSALSSVLKEWDTDRFLRYDKNGSYRREQLMYMDLTTQLETSNFKLGALYLITGGAGGIGKIIASAMVGCRVVLTGRSQMNTSIKETLDQLQKSGVDAYYLSADISKLDEIQALISQIHQQFGAISGVFHSAGVFRNGFVLNKKLQEIKWYP